MGASVSFPACGVALVYDVQKRSQLSGEQPPSNSEQQPPRAGHQQRDWKGRLLCFALPWTFFRPAKPDLDRYQRQKIERLRGALVENPAAISAARGGLSRAWLSWRAVAFSGRRQRVQAAGAAHDRERCHGSLKVAQGRGSRPPGRHDAQLENTVSRSCVDPGRQADCGNTFYPALISFTGRRSNISMRGSFRPGAFASRSTTATVTTACTRESRFNPGFVEQQRLRPDKQQLLQLRSQLAHRHFRATGPRLRPLAKSDGVQRRQRRRDVGWPEEAMRLPAEGRISAAACGPRRRSGLRLPLVPEAEGGLLGPQAWSDRRTEN